MTIYLVLQHYGEVTVSAFYIGFEKSSGFRFVPKTVTLLHDLDSRTASLLSKRYGHEYETIFTFP
ncbi:unnamed protein product [Musa hybrid cultivar]